MKKERPHTEYEKPAEGNHNPGYGHRKVIVQTTGVLGAATSLSRVTGLVRDIVVAAQFGAGMVRCRKGPAPCASARFTQAATSRAAIAYRDGFDRRENGYNLLSFCVI